MSFIDPLGLDPVPPPGDDEKTKPAVDKTWLDRAKELIPKLAKSAAHFVDGVVNSYGSNQVFGLGRNNDFTRSIPYRAGQVFGDLVSMAQGARDAVAGVVFAEASGAAGLAFALPTGGTSVPVGGVGVAAGVAYSLHGVGAASTAVYYGSEDLRELNEMLEGNDAPAAEPPKVTPADRKAGVKEAWKQEKELVEKTEKGTVRWTKSEQKQLLDK